MSVSSQKIVDLMKEWSDYQKFGHQVQWQTLPQIFKECNGLNSNIKINIKRNNISIISTPVARIIMSSIVNNTAMHGGENANEVNVGWEKIPQGVAIICEDNGVGIPDLQKSVIFEKGFGRHRGMGLYLVKEILNMSGLKIAEKGTYGKGARFEIYVPDGAYKLY
jgi:signal transduction histidine kinase